jgi:hypothetical protein
MFFHTDVEDFATVARDVARCLCPGGRFIYVGLHPCFIGPFVNRPPSPAGPTIWKVGDRQEAEAAAPFGIVT